MIIKIYLRKSLIKIEDFLIDNGLTYEFLSSIYGKKKFKLLVSTEICPLKNSNYLVFKISLCQIFWLTY